MSTGGMRDAAACECMGTLRTTITERKMQKTVLLVLRMVTFSREERSSKTAARVTGRLSLPPHAIERRRPAGACRSSELTMDSNEMRSLPLTRRMFYGSRDAQYGSGVWWLRGFSADNGWSDNENLQCRRRAVLAHETRARRLTWPVLVPGPGVASLGASVWTQQWVRRRQPGDQHEQQRSKNPSHRYSIAS